MSTASKTIVIAALSSRVYAEAAVAVGLDVIAIDAYADQDLLQSAVASHLVEAQDGQLNGKQVLAVLNTLDKDLLLGFCYGAGFEADPEVLKQISNQITLLGNAGAIVQQCKQPLSFFGLCDQLKIPFPAVSLQPPADPTNWIQKKVGASGGGHIALFNKSTWLKANDVYYQQHQAGSTISCLFVVTNRHVEIIGFSLQWTDTADVASFRYGGAVGHAPLHDNIKERFSVYIHRLALGLGLQGVNSCDAIIDDDELYVLEINPRLSATIDLYPQSDLMSKHLVAFQHEINVETVDRQQIPRQQNIIVNRAHQIIYARHMVVLDNEIIWPCWVHDKPKANQQFQVGAPICTVSAEADTLSQAKALLAVRAAWVERQLIH